MADGWIKVWRKIADSPMWLEKPFSKGQAWIDMLLLATASDHVSKYKGKEKKYTAGTVHFSICYMTNRWGWSRNKVYRFIRKLQNDGMIEYQGRTPNGTTCGTSDGTINGTTDGTTSDTVLIVVNWGLYQSRQSRNGTTDGTTNDTIDGTPKRTRNGTHPKKDIYPKNDISKEGKDGNENPLPSSVETIRPEIDLVGCPAYEDLPSEADGTKRDIPKRVRHLFTDYGAFLRYMERMNEDAV